LKQNKNPEEKPDLPLDLKNLDEKNPSTTRLRLFSNGCK
jgi:hypothetical protein